MFWCLNPNLINVKANLYDLIPIAKKNMFDAIEYCPLQIDKQYGYRNVLDKLNEYDLYIASFMLPVVYQRSLSLFNKTLSNLEKAAEIAKAMNISRCWTVIAYGSNTLDYGSHFELYVERLRICAMVLREYGISLCLEFVGIKSMYTQFAHTFIHDLPGAIELCKTINTGNVGILLDSYQCFASGLGSDGFKEYIRNGSDVVVVQISNVAVGISAEQVQSSPAIYLTKQMQLI